MLKRMQSRVISLSPFFSGSVCVCVFQGVNVYEDTYVPQMNSICVNIIEQILMSLLCCLKSGLILLATVHIASF